MPDLPPLSCSKIEAGHLERLAIVYVRQSSPQQVHENRESTARQYALAQYAQVLGWPAERVLVIDEDQGQSGKFAENRAGFQRLLAEVTMEHAGIVLGLIDRQRTRSRQTAWQRRMVADGSRPRTRDESYEASRLGETWLGA